MYEDLAPPVRQRWHQRAARMLDGEGAPQEEVTVHLLAADTAGDLWVVGKLREAAADARRRGAPDVAALCLQRVLAEPPPAAMRAGVLLELGQLEAMQAPAAAVSHLTEALAESPDWPRRGAISLTLGEALALGGRFSEAVDLLARTAAEAADEGSRESLQAALLNTARMDIGTRAVAQPLLERIQARAARGEELDPQLHANLAIELAAAGQDREGAVRNARKALTAMPRLMSASTAALPETISVLLFADCAAEARAAADTWLKLAQQQGSQPVAATATGLASLISLYGGEVSEAVAFGQQGIAGTPNVWISTITSAFVVRALVERGELGEAHALQAALGLAGDLPPTWPHNLVRHARGCLHAAAGDHAAAVGDLLAAGELAERWGIPNPAILPWRSSAALSLRALGDRPAATRLCAEEIGFARRWGRPRPRHRAACRGSDRWNRPRHRTAHRGGDRTARGTRAARTGSRAGRPRRGTPPGRRPNHGTRDPPGGPGSGPCHGWPRAVRPGPARTCGGRRQPHGGHRRGRLPDVTYGRLTPRVRLAPSKGVLQMGVLQYSSVKPALAEPVLTAVSPYMFWLMFRNVASDGFVFEDPVNAGVVSEPGCVIASPSWENSATHVSQDYVYNWTRDAAIVAIELAAGRYPPASR